MTGGHHRDWALIRQRLESMERTLREDAHPSEAELDRIFRERAEGLARPLAHPQDQETETFLVFNLSFNGADARLGIPLSGIAEAIRQPRIALAPGAPPEVAGLIQVRGEIRSVWNLGPALGLPAPQKRTAGAESERVEQVLLLRDGAQELAVIAGRIEGVVDYDARQVRQTPGDTPGTWVTADYVTVLDVKSLFDKLQGPTTS